MTQTGTQTASNPSAELHELIRHLVHELRQPLGGIESLAYYFELALEDADEELREQCVRLRQLVAQASWMLEDAALAAAAGAMEPEPVSLNAIVSGYGEALARHEDRSLRLEMDAGAPRVLAAPACMRRWLGHVLSFLRDLAGGEPMPHVETSGEGGGVWLRVSSAIASEECLRVLDPPGGAGGLRRVAELAGGRYEVQIHGRSVTAALWLPGVGHLLD